MRQQRCQQNINKGCSWFALIWANAIAAAATA
jgi:hypothetical protein